MRNAGALDWSNNAHRSDGRSFASCASGVRAHPVAVFLIWAMNALTAGARSSRLKAGAISTGLVNSEINDVLADAKIHGRFAELGGKLVGGSAADFGQLIAHETDKRAKVVRMASPSDRRLGPVANTISGEHDRRLGNRAVVARVSSAKCAINRF